MAGGVAVIEPAKMGGNLRKHRLRAEEGDGGMRANLAHAVDAASDSLNSLAQRVSHRLEKLVTAQRLHHQHQPVLGRLRGSTAASPGSTAAHVSWMRARSRSTVSTSAGHIVIATGGHPIAMRRAPIWALPRWLFALAEQPRRVATIGAGYIGVELAGCCAPSARGQPGGPEARAGGLTA